jgi:N-acetylglucosamine kinase-like BadF-type ATPase
MRNCSGIAEFFQSPLPAKTGVQQSGCTLAGLNKEGKTLQIGGVGYVSNDLGGGGYMGGNVVSAVFSELFRKAGPTGMTPALMKYLGITDKHDFVERIYAMIEDNSFSMIECMKILFNAAAENDKAAMKIFTDVAANYAGGISVMIDEMKFPENETINIVLAGSVFVKGENPVLINLIKGMLSNYNPAHKISYIVLDVPPAAGAVIWALNILNGRTEYYDKVCAEFKKAAVL